MCVVVVVVVDVVACESCVQSMRARLASDHNGIVLMLCMFL